MMSKFLHAGINLIKPVFVFLADLMFGLCLFVVWVKTKQHLSD